MKNNTEREHFELSGLSTDVLRYLAPIPGCEAERKELARRNQEGADK